MREYIESIVFYGGEAMEMERLNQLLEEVRACRTRVIVAAAPMVFLVLINAIALYFIPVMMASASAIYLGDTAYGSQFDAFNYGGAVASSARLACRSQVSSLPAVAWATSSGWCIVLSPFWRRATK